MVALVYTGIFPIGVVHVTWAYVLARLPASRAASLLYLIPVIAAFVAWVILHETPGWVSVAGTALVFLGVAIVNSRTKRQDGVAE